MINSQVFPRNIGINENLKRIKDCFVKAEEQIKSPENKLSSNEVLHILRPQLIAADMTVEEGKIKANKITVPVLFGINDKIELSFNADGLSTDRKIVLEVEAGRAVDNHQFLKDIFQASMMIGVEYLVLAVRNNYRGQEDFLIIYKFLETLYISNRIQLPLKGILLIGY